MTHRPSTPRALACGLLAALVLFGVSGCASTSSTRADSSPVVAYRQLGEAYLQDDNLVRATAALNRALALDPNDPGALQAMALVYQRQGENELADEHFQHALDEDPNFTRARNNYAAFLYDQGQTESACHELEQAAMDIHYDHRAQLFANLGRCQWELGRLAPARAALVRAQEIDPRQPLSYLTMAELEYAQGNLEHAQTQLNRYIHLVGVTPDSQHLATAITQAKAAEQGKNS